MARSMLKYQRGNDTDLVTFLSRSKGNTVVDNQKNITKSTSTAGVKQLPKNAINVIMGSGGTPASPNYVM